MLLDIIHLLCMWHIIYIPWIWLLSIMFPRLYPFIYVLQWIWSVIYLFEWIWYIIYAFYWGRLVICVFPLIWSIICAFEWTWHFRTLCVCVCVSTEVSHYLVSLMSIATYVTEGVVLLFMSPRILLVAYVIQWTCKVIVSKDAKPIYYFPTTYLVTNMFKTF
jgi:hypothetical protein